MKVITISLFCLLSASLFAQLKPKSELKKIVAEQPVNSNDSQTIYTRDYFINPDKLIRAFVSGVIPSDFPKFDASKSENENREIVRVWAKANKSLIREKHWSKIEK